MDLTSGQVSGLKSIVNSCLDQLFQNDNHLMDRSGLERSAAFRFGVYLNSAVNNIGWLTGLTVDMEYTKNGLYQKIIPSKLKGAHPDLILHNRGNNDKNVLVIEFKGYWSRTQLKSDRIKLTEFTDKEGNYRYGLGLLIKFGKKRDTVMIEYF